MMWFAAVEAIATACIMLANAVILRETCAKTDASIPKCALALQIAANVAWMTYAIGDRDVYLCSTATTSLGMQCSSLWLRLRHNDTYSHRQIQFTSSEEQLPRI